MRFALLLTGLLSASTGPSAVADSETIRPELFIDVSAASVSVRGAVSSAGHEAILRDTLARHFAGRAAEMTVSARPALAPGWALVTDVTLEALAVTSSATARITTDAVAVRGITADGAAWRNAASRISRSLLPGMHLEDQVVEVRQTASLNRQCLELFRTAMRGRRVEFEHGSEALGTAAMPLLDELIQIAADCPGSMIEITGHTDGSGDEAANTALSQARADAVAAYLESGGIARARIGAKGAGSSEPLTAESSTQARRMNRRTEIELVFP